MRYYTLLITLLFFSAFVFAEGNLAIGQQQVEKTSCAGCHGVAGHSFSPANPKLAGQVETYLVEAMIAYKNQQRQHGLMVAIMQPYSLQEIEHFATFYAQQPACQSTGQKTELSISDTLQSTLEGCQFCHNNENTVNPKLAGQHELYLLESMLAYRNGQRENALMASFLSELDKKTLQAIARFYSQQITCQ